jgi:hypothetical protein
MTRGSLEKRERERVLFTSIWTLIFNGLSRNILLPGPHPGWFARVWLLNTILSSNLDIQGCNHAPDMFSTQFSAPKLLTTLEPFG